jgi:uncharacterized protein YqgQ
MITKEDYLKAKEVVKQYNLQQKTNNKKINKTILLLNKTDEEITEFLRIYFKDKEYYTYTPLVFIIKKIYEENLNSKIGRNNAVIVLDKLQKRKIIIKDGGFGSARYYLNYIYSF